jgi:hypothetical protein
MENKIDARCCLQIGIKFYVQFMVCGELEMKLSMMAILEQKKGSPVSKPGRRINIVPSWPLWSFAESPTAANAARGVLQAGLLKKIF